MKALLAAAALMLAAVPASADQATAVRTMLAAKGSAAVIPTGIDVDGCTYRKVHRPGAEAFAQVCDPKDTASSYDFWRGRDATDGGTTIDTGATP